VKRENLKIRVKKTTTTLKGNCRFWEEPNGLDVITYGILVYEANLISHQDYYT